MRCLNFSKVRDWAGVSRPQIYYSLDKLARRELVRPLRGDATAGGPERNVYETTPRGRAALADALERADWAEQNERPAFLTWVALSWQCRPGIVAEQIGRRRKFLEQELSRKQETLASVRKEVGHQFHEAVWMLNLNIDQIRTELRWLRKKSTANSPGVPRRGIPITLLDRRPDQADVDLPGKVPVRFFRGLEHRKHGVHAGDFEQHLDMRGLTPVNANLWPVRCVCDQRLKMVPRPAESIYGTSLTSITVSASGASRRLSLQGETK